MVSKKAKLGIGVGGLAGLVALLAGGLLWHYSDRFSTGTEDSGSEEKDVSVESKLDGGIDINLDMPVVPGIRATLPYDIRIVTQDLDLDLPIEKRVEVTRDLGRKKGTKVIYEPINFGQGFTYRFLAANDNARITSIEVYRKVDGKVETRYVGGIAVDGVGLVSIEDQGEYRIKFGVVNDKVGKDKIEAVVLDVRVGDPKWNGSGIEVSGGNSGRRSGEAGDESIGLDMGERENPR